MIFSTSHSLSESEKEAVRLLWNQEFPYNFKKELPADFQKFLDDVADHQFIVVRDNTQNLIGWLFIFSRNEEIWFSILVDAKFQGKGLGRKLLDKAKALKPELNGWVADRPYEKKMNGNLYRSPIDFYIKNEFEVLDERLEKGEISAAKIRWRRII